MEFPANPVKPVSKLVLAGWIATFVLDVAVYVLFVVLVAKGIGWILPLFGLAGLRSTLVWDKNRIRSAFALRHHVKAESFAAEVIYSRGKRTLGSDAGAAYMHNGMLCFEGLYSRFRLDPKWVLHAGRHVAESVAWFTLVDRSANEWVGLSINSIKEDGKGGKSASNEVGRYLTPWLNEECSEESQPLFPLTKPNPSRWYQLWTVVDNLICIGSLIAASAMVVLQPRFGLLEKVVACLILAVSIAVIGIISFFWMRLGLKLRKQMRRLPLPSDESFLTELLKEESEFIRTQSQPLSTQQEDSR